MKEEELSKEFDESDLWICSSGWPSLWKKRHDVAYGSISRENAAVDKDVYDDWKQWTLQPILSRNDPNDIFNADETALYWQLLPDKTHAFKGEACTGTKIE